MRRNYEIFVTHTLLSSKDKILPFFILLFQKKHSFLGSHGLCSQNLGLCVLFPSIVGGPKERVEPLPHRDCFILRLTQVKRTASEIWKWSPNSNVDLRGSLEKSLGRDC